MAYFGNSESIVQKIEPRTAFLVLWVILCGIVLILIAKENLTDNPPPPPQVNSIVDPMKRKVVIAKSQIDPGQPITPDAFELSDRDIKGLEEQVLYSVSEIEGRFLENGLKEGEIVLRRMLTSEIPYNVMMSRIPEGFRAVTIAADTESSVAGWVRTGARVDVVWSSVVDGKTSVSTIVENAEVLSTNANDSKSPGFITLMVPRKDAQRIQLAKNSGTLSLNLRGADTSTEQNIGSATITVDNLLNRKETSAQGDWIQVGDKVYSVLENGRLSRSDETIQKQ